MAPTAKRQRKEPEDTQPAREASEDETMEAGTEDEAESSEGEGSVASGSSSTDTETEINRAQNAKSKKTLSEYHNVPKAL